MTRAVFLDRDGTINIEVGYLNHPDQVELIPRAGAGIKLLNEAGLKAIVITNQAGIARGVVREDLLPDIHQRLMLLLAREGAALDGFYYCPHHPEGVVEQYRITCDCRKPLPGMLLQAAGEYSIDLSASYVIGDKSCDMELARNAGTKAVMVLTGYGEKELARHRAAGLSPPDYIAQDLYAAAQWILGHSRSAADDAGNRAR
jgi:D-glycero-D-manno-heptose 1,7-bisphosphate phosphatase